MRVQLTKPQGERGAVAVTVALLTIPLLILAAFTVDFGMAYAQGQAYGTGADSAALAIVNAKREPLLAPPAVPPTCDQIRTADAALGASDPAKASNIALVQVNANTNFGTQLTQSDVTTTLSCTPEGVLRADVAVRRNVPTSFGGLVGVSSIKADRNAAAALGIAKKVTGVFPMAICTLQAEEIVNHAAASGEPYPAEVIKSDKVWGSGALCQPQQGNGSGNWGWLDCGNGVSVPDLVNYINSGCNASLVLSGSNPPTTTIDGTPGNKVNASGLQSALLAALDKVYAFPVYTTISGQGSGTEYTITGFIQLKLCAGAGKTGTCYDNTVPMGSDDLQVRYVAYVPVGQINALCGIGGASCPSFNSYVTNLIQ